MLCEDIVSSNLPHSSVNPTAETRPFERSNHCHTSGRQMEQKVHGRLPTRKVNGPEHQLHKVPGACSFHHLQFLPTSRSWPPRCTTLAGPRREKQKVFSAEICSLGQEELIYFQSPIISS